MVDKDAAAMRVDLDHLTVPQLRALIAEAEAKLRDKQEKAKAELLSKWQAEAEENGFSFRAMLPGIPPQPEKASRKSSGESLPVKYRGPNGEAWSGRGRLPKWLQAAEAEGKNRENFRVK